MLIGSTGPMLLTYTAVSITVGLTERAEVTQGNEDNERHHILTDTYKQTARLASDVRAKFVVVALQQFIQDQSHIALIDLW